MGRKKSARGKEKKIKWKEDQKKLSESKELVTAANKSPNHLDGLPAFQVFNRNGLNVSIECRKLCDIDPDSLNSAFTLTKKNMETLYSNSSWGWDDKDKFNEMTEESAWYLFARDTNGQLVAISHFRFDIDENVEVLYCYEIQLEESVRGKGLGKFIMQILELICFKAKMKKVILTIFKSNNGAIDFFTKLKYVIDETSPRYFDPLHPELYDYEILSKTIKRN